MAGSEDLFMFSRRIPAAQKRQIFREALRHDAPATLVCADRNRPTARALVLDNAGVLDEDFLRTAAEICLALRLTPVVVSVAASEKAARHRQQKARQAFAALHVGASFDYLIGCEVRSAITQIASWRRCQIVIGQHETCAPWRRWLRDTTVEEFMHLLESLSFMILSEANRRAGLRLRMPAAPSVREHERSFLLHW
jgi:K+-sensing histidine kinase KdpD